MFVSFFPNPRPFFWSAAAWSLIAVLAWFFFFRDFGAVIGLPNPPVDAPPIISAYRFISPPYLWFYVYFAGAFLIFAGVWKSLSPLRWFNWSVGGSAIIVFVTYFLVQVSVTINDWFGQYFDLVQKALTTPGSVKSTELYAGLLDITSTLFTYIIIAVVFRFFTSHFIFRWRTAMNDFYTDNWPKVRGIEGASQRVQEDTRLFVGTTEGLGAEFVSAIMTLISFLPVLAVLSDKVKEVPLLGAIPYSLVVVSLLWAIFGTGFLALIGFKLPGLEFKKQRVEAAYRKELVYGEDDAARAQPATVANLFENVRKTTFSLYSNYLYFNVGRYSYLQADLLLPFFVLVPAVATGAITFGIFQQVRTAFGEVRDAMQYLVKSWPTIVELISVYKRLRTFEAAIHGEAIDPKSEYLTDGMVVRG